VKGSGSYMNYFILCFKVMTLWSLCASNLHSAIVCIKKKHAVKKHIEFKCKKSNENPKTIVVIRNTKDLIDGMDVELYGFAESTKMGPCISLSGTYIIIKNYNSWPNQLSEKYVAVKGRLKLEKVPYHPDNEFRAHPMGDFWWIIPESIQLKD
jgi:hypothetical protein